MWLINSQGRKGLELHLIWNSSDHWTLDACWMRSCSGSPRSGTDYSDADTWYGCHQWTIERLHHEFRTAGQITDLPHPAHPRITTRHQEADVQRAHILDRFATVVTATCVTLSRSDQSDSATTIGHWLHENWIRAVIPYHGLIWNEVI